ncbi:MAG: outer membrane protein [Polaribacter sp.]|jgi:outer membrane protein
MKTKITLCIAVLLIGFTSNAQTKVGTVDSEYIITKMPQFNLVQERIKSYGAKLDSIHTKKIAAYDNKLKAFNDASKTLSEADKKTKYAELGDLNKNVVMFRENGTKMMQIRKDEFMIPLYKKLADVTAVIAKENGYTQILTTTGNEFAYIDSRFDITKLILDKLSSKE